MKNLKDNLANIAKWALAISIFVMGLPTALESTYDVSITYPKYIYVICGIVALASNFIGLHLLGKNSDGSTKAPEQLTTKIEVKEENKTV